VAPFQVCYSPPSDVRVGIEELSTRLSAPDSRKAQGLSDWNVLH